MDLHGIVAPYIGAVNPLIDVVVRLSTGPGPTQPDGSQPAGYATPGAFTGAIADDVLTVSAISSGVLLPFQTIVGAGVSDDTEIVEQLTGDPGGVGTYRLNRLQAAAVSAEPMTSALIMSAQVQPIAWRDLQMLDGINMSGTRRKIYLYGAVDSVNRVNRKGGDLITIAVGGPDDGVWMVAQVLEQFPDWVSAAITLQNDEV